MRLTLDHRPPQDPSSEWPFAYHAEQIFAVTENVLSVRLCVRNDDRHRFPAGIGLHPYVARGDGSELGFDAATIWQPGPDDLPVSPMAVPADCAFAPPREIGGTVRDACYAGWGGEAVVTMPAHGIALHIQAGKPLHHLQLYTPEGEDFCGIEPVSNMPDGINRMHSVADQGMKMLAPGETLWAVITFRVSSITPPDKISEAGRSARSS